MGPRLVLIAVAVILVGFGLLMVYSASSITALTQEAYGFDATYFLKRQAILAALATVVAIVLARVDYHVWSRTLLPIIWIGTLGLLVLIMTPVAGSDAYGATRWIRIGSFTFQPSEFAKLTVILTAANLAQRYFEDRTIEMGPFIGLMVAGCGLPLVLILAQPDKGTTIIVCATLLVMGYLAGVPKRFLVIALGLGAAGFLFLILKDSYSRARVMTMIDPWSDPYGDGYQVIQGLDASGSGGVFGMGLGNSRQKSSYLPMAHNDFIYAVIGEELGLVGTLAVLALFALLVWIGFRIARSAPDLSGRLIASGCMTLLAIQLSLNACGVLCMAPLSGKPVPFISYGGSSVISTLILMGLVISVARTAQASPSRGFTVHEGTMQGLRVIEGGLGSPADVRASHGAQGPAGRVSFNANGTRRIDLGPSASDRLRGRDAGRGGRG
jgi:cell division protein FtsW